jgi:hypothetical protein
MLARLEKRAEAPVVICTAFVGVCVYQRARLEELSGPREHQCLRALRQEHVFQEEVRVPSTHTRGKRHVLVHLGTWYFPALSRTMLALE